VTDRGRSWRETKMHSRTERRKVSENLWATLESPARLRWNYRAPHRYNL